MAVSLANDERARGPWIAKRSQCTLVMLVGLANFSTGTYLAWPAIASPIFDQNGYPTNNQGTSWVRASVALGAIIGSLPAGTIAGRISRKRSILISSLLLSSCWFVIGFARGKLWLFLARFVAGLSCGVSSILIPLYLSEIMVDCVKISLRTMLQLATALGVLFTYSVEFTNSLTTIVLLCALAPGFLSIATQSIPESPVWLIRQNRQTAAQEILTHYGGRRLSEQEISRESVPISELWKHRKATIIALGMMMFQQLSGMNTLISYATTIFRYIRFPLSPTSCSIIVGLTYVIATLSSESLIDRTKRKLLLFLSLSIMSVSMFVLSGYFRLQKTEDVSNFTWLPFLSFIIYVAAFGVGCGPIPWILIEKIFPEDVKTTAISASIVCEWLSAFVAMKLFQDMLSSMGISSTFAAYGMVSLIGTAFVAILVPETEGRSIEEIQIELHKEHDTSGYCI
ncbi:facilitated trehalose transporter Tret1-like [Nomia melanderi]|uniref:facilitated trehalose transporter Tret1-like n=1 Tax=Nomia melanderi TaxID=2448451 RepID=UPI0013044734|nr:facilitated trehalose transporter Tret1-like [Nomia melanderi]